MYSTMQNFPLTITAILRHACGIHGARRVTTATGSGYRDCSYAELGEQSAQLANALRSLGINRDQRVATFMWNNQEHLTAYLAIPAMGAVLHTLNIRLFADQIVYVANEAEDQVVLVDLSLVKLLAPILGRLDTVHTVIAVGEGSTAALDESGKTVLRYTGLIAGESTEFDWPDIDENSAAAMCYTSGTTGNPKGVVYSHRSSYLHTMAACTTNGIGVSSSDRVLPVVPMFHANAWGLPYAALMAGADLVLPDRHLDAKSLVDLVETLRPTVAGAVPTIWNDVLHYLEKNPSHDMSSLRLVACGGSAVPVSLMRTFEEQHGVQIRQLWGMTETSPMATMAWPPPGTPDEQQWALRATQGQPVCGVEARIVDDDNNVLPNDGAAVGELEVRGPWITGSYYGGADESKFESGWLRTG
ncbi:long-chain-fatty-acid--CoA ligase, partial [Mycobacterium sp.]|uniref:long-chain-fatty-acid--CoA ligase n=1 Tax=Mycobacterium sp. TaxID=1785 RepID=UPI003D6B2E02